MLNELSQAVGLRRAVRSKYHRGLGAFHTHLAAHGHAACCLQASTLQRGATTTYLYEAKKSQRPRGGFLQLVCLLRDHQGTEAEKC